MGIARDMPAGMMILCRAYAYDIRSRVPGAETCIAEHDSTRPMHTRGAKGFPCVTSARGACPHRKPREEPFYFGTRPLERNTSAHSPPLHASYSGRLHPPRLHFSSPSSPTARYFQPSSLTAVVTSDPYIRFAAEREGKKISKYTLLTV